MKLKVCGITTVEQLAQLEALDVDYAGFIFYPKSKRYAFEKLQPYKKEIRNVDVKKVGVFVNADMGFLKSLITDLDLSAVQLHGDETPEYCAQLQMHVDIIKVFRISETIKDIDLLVEPFQLVCSYFLFDTDTTTYGGSGRRFDWTILKSARINKPFFLSGGIGPDDMGILKSFSHPFLYAVDVNSRFETAPGVKNMAKLKPFVTALKQPAWIK